MDLSFDYEPKMSREAMKDEALERMELLDLPAYAKAGSIMIENHSGVLKRVL